MSRLQKAIAVIVQLYQEGVIEDLALTGAVAAMYYTEPANTKDVDFLAPLELNLDPLRSIFNALRQRGYSQFNNQGLILIEGWPVDFVPVSNELQQEMLATAKMRQVGPNLNCKIALPEYLAAESVRVGRPDKDYSRAIQLRALPQFNEQLFQQVLNKFGLLSKWKRIEKI